MEVKFQALIKKVSFDDEASSKITFESFTNCCDEVRKLIEFNKDKNVVEVVVKLAVV